MAKGAVYVNQGKLKWGAAEFKRALKLDPKHLNANKYLEAVNKRIEMDEQVEGGSGADGGGGGSGGSGEGASGSRAGKDAAEGDKGGDAKSKGTEGGDSGD